MAATFLDRVPVKIDAHAALVSCRCTGFLRRGEVEELLAAAAQLPAAQRGEWLEKKGLRNLEITYLPDREDFGG